MVRRKSLETVGTLVGLHLPAVARSPEGASATLVTVDVSTLAEVHRGRLSHQVLE